MKQKTFIRRAATALLTIALTATTAWAQTTETVSYIDADGTQKSVTATVLTGDITQSGFELNAYGNLLMPAGWYVVKNSNADGVDASSNTDIKATGDHGTIHIILADGAEMTVNGGPDYGFDLGTGYPLAIYGQSAGTGRLTVSSSSYRAIYSSDDITINGGIVSATSSSRAIYSSSVTINGGQVTATGGENQEGIHGTTTLGCRKLTDFIKSNGFGGSIVTIKSGQTLYDGNTAYSGTLSTAQRSALANSTLRPFSSDDLAVNDDNTEYTIHTATGWGLFCDMLAQSDKGVFSGKTVLLGNDIEVSRMAGSDYHDFTGTFDGQGHTLTFNYGEDGNPASDEYAAPFSKITNDNNVAVTIRNLHVSGHIYTSAKYAAGIVGRHWGTLNIVNCRSSIAIHSSVSGDGTHAGFEAINSGTVNIEGCLFDGKLLTVNTGETATINCAGFVGYGNGNVTNSLYAPAALGDGETEVGTTQSATFARGDAKGITITNCYYTRLLGTAQGKQALSATASPVGDATQTYNVSGITAYANGLTLDNGTDPATFYYGQGDEVAVSYTLPDGTTAPEPATATVLGGNAEGGADLAAGSYLVASDITYTGTVNLTGNVTLILKDGCNMTIGSSDSRINNDGIDGYVDGTETWYDITIYGQTAGTGAVNVYVTGDNKHGIYVNALTVNGGNITADANGDDACAIAANANLTINGGQVTATASGDAFALASNSDITINGGNVTATGTGSAYGITAKGNITISGGTVTATGGNDGYGICADYNVNINGGNVTISGYGGICANNGDITLGWTNATDRIYASSYYLTSGSGTVTIADGHKLYNGSKFLSGTVSTSAVNGKTLRPAATATYTTADGTTDTADAILLDASDTSLPAGNYLATGTLNYTHRITIAGDVTLILADGCEMNVGASSNRIEVCGIAKSSKWSLTITSQSIGSDMGALSIYTTGPNNYAIYAKDVTINGGNITADTNTDYCPAITADDNITINGGTVNANTTGNEADAFYSDETFNYNGGIVNATAAHGYAIYVEDGNYNFSWRNATDRINIGATGLGTEDGFTATFASTMTDGLGNAYTGTIDADGITALNARAASNDGLTLQPGNSLAANQAPDGNYWTTYYNGAFGHVIPDHENACAYTATHADGQLTLHRLGTDGKTIPADCAVIIVADNPEVSMTVTNADPFTGENDLRGFDSEEQLDNIPEYFGINGSFTYYVLGMTTVNTPDGPEKHFGFHRYTGYYMAAHKAFLMLPAAQAARSLDMVFGDETGIKTTNFTNSTNSDDAWYDMQGRRLGGKPTAKGIYVNKGIKVVIK